MSGFRTVGSGNSKSFNDHPELVKKAMNKEDRYSHLVPIDEDICRVSAYLRLILLNRKAHSDQDVPTNNPVRDFAKLISQALILICIYNFISESFTQREGWSIVVSLDQT